MTHNKWLCSFVITMTNFSITFISKCYIVVKNCSTYKYVLCNSDCIQYSYYKMPSTPVAVRCIINSCTSMQICTIL